MIKSPSSFFRIIDFRHILLVSLLVLIIWTPFFFASSFNNAYADWTFRKSYMSYTVTSIFKYGEFPYWVTSPEYEQLRLKGVHVFFANPETHVLSPYIFLYAVFPYMTAAKIFILIHLLVGVTGCYFVIKKLRRRNGLPFFILFSLLVLCNGAFVSHVSVGHLQFASYAYFPLIYYFFTNALETSQIKKQSANTLAAGILLSLSYYEGNAHVLFHFMIFLFLYAYFSIKPDRRSLKRHIFALIMLIGSFFLFSAFKMLPGLYYFSAYKSHYLKYFFNYKEFFLCFIDPIAPIGKHTHEYNMFIGKSGLLLLLSGFVFIKTKRQKVLLMCFFLFFLFCFCPFPGFFSSLPFFQTQGVYSRFRLVMLFIMILGSVEGLMNCFSSQNFAQLKRPHKSMIYIFFFALLSVLSLELSLHGIRTRVNPEDHGFRYRQRLPRLQIQAPRFVSCSPNTYSIEPVSNGINYFRYRITPTAQEAVQPEKIMFYSPDISFKNVKPALKIIGEGEITSYNGFLAVELPSMHDGVIELRQSHIYTLIGKWLSASFALFILVYSLLLTLMKK